MTWLDAVARQLGLPALANRKARRALLPGLALTRLEDRSVPATMTWDGGGGDDNWTTAANWVGDVSPGATDDLVFPTGAARLNNTNDFAANTNFNSITLAGGYNVTGNAVTLTTSLWANFSSDVSEFSPGIALAGNATVDVANGGDLILSGAISGSGFGITKTGGGILEYTGFSANTYTGATTVAEGTLILNRSSGTIAGDLVIGDNIGGGESVQIGSNNQIADTSAVTVNGGATLDLSGSSDTIGSLTMTGATVATGSGMLTLGGDVTTNTSTTTSVISGNLDLGGATRTFNVSNESNTDPDLSISANISGTGAGIIKAGANSQLLLSGNNTYDGTTTVAAGAIEVASANALGATSAGTVVNSGYSIAFLGGITLAAEPFTISGVGFGGLGALFNGNGNNTITGPITLAANSTIGSLSGNLTFSGVISDGVSSFDLTKVQSGTVTLNGANSYDGGTNVNGGVLGVGHSDALGTGAAAINSGGSLALSGGITVANTIGISGVPASGASKIINSSGDNTIQGDIPISGGNNQSFDVAGGTTLTASGVISGSRDFDKNGTGTLILTGTNTHTGNVNVGDGTLIVNGSLATSNSVFSDGIVGGSGTLPAVTISGIGTLAPGNSPGVLSTGNLAFSDSGSTYSVELNGTTVGTQYDQTDVTGTVTLAGATLSVSQGYNPTVGDSFTIVNNDGTDAVSGTFNGLAEGSTITIGGVQYTISYVGGSNGNDVVLTVTAVTCTWTGAAADRDWTNPANWAGGFAPTAGADLVFASGAVTSESVNDFAPGTVFKSITVASSGYDIYGNAIDLTNGVTTTFAAGSSGIDLAITLLSNKTFDVAAGGTLSYTGSLSGGFGLTKTGAGTLALSGTNTYTGATVVNGGTLATNSLGSTSSLTLDGGTLSALSTPFSVGVALTIGSGGATVNLSNGSISLSGISGSAGLTVNSTNGGNSLSTATDNSGTFSGTTTLNNGILEFGHDAAYGTGTIVLNGGRVRAQGPTARTIANALSIGGTLTMSGSAALTFTGNVDLLAGTRTINDSISSNLTFSGVVSNGNLTVNSQGSGTVVLSGTNTYTATTVTAGTLSVAGDSSLGSGAVTLNGGTLVVTGTGVTIDNPFSLGNSGGTVSNANALTLSGAVTGPGGLTKTGAGTLTLSGTNTYAATTVSAGTLTVAGDANLGSGAVGLAAGTTLAVTTATTIDNALTLSGNATVSNSAAVTLSGLLSGSSTLTKSGAGVLTLVNLGNEASFSGPITVSSGTLSVADDDSLGSGSLTFSGGFLNVTATTAIDNSIILNVVATAINVSSGVTATLSGVVSETGGSRALNKGSSGTLLLSGNNTYTGNTNLNGGTISVAGDANLGSGTIRFNQGGTLLVTGSGTIDNAIFFNVPGTFDITGTVTLSGVIDGTSNLSKSGVGTLTLTAIETYTGSTTVSAGTLVVNGSIASSSLVTVASGGTIGGSGSLPSTTMATGGTLSPGNSPGVLSTGDLAFQAGATYAVDLNGATVGTQYDQTDVTGTVALGDATISLSLGYTPTIGTAYTVINNDGSDAVSGTFNGLAEGATLTFGATTLTISYVGGDGNDVVLTVADVTFVWDGGGTDRDWTNGVNWVGDVAPVAGANLVFAGGAVTSESVNTFSAGTTFNSITVTSSGYDIYGNAIDLTNGITTTYTSGNSAIDLGIALLANTTFGIAGGGTLTYTGVLSGSFGLTKAGAGTLTLSGANTLNSLVLVSSGTLVVNGQLSGAVTVENGATLRGLGIIGGAAVIQSGGTLSPGNSPGGLTFDAGLTLASGSTLAVGIDGTTPVSGYDQIFVFGTVDLTGSTLTPSLGFAPAAGDTFTVIENDGIDLVTGTFAGLAEGALLTRGGATFRISYVGGTGNDVTLTAVETVAVAGRTSATPSAFGQAVTFSVTVTGTGTPTGNVTLMIDGTAVETVALTGGSATFSPVSNLAVGSHTVSFEYAGDVAHLPTSGDLVGGQVVEKAATTVAIGTSTNPSVEGQGVTFTATVSSAVGIPTGTVTFRNATTGETLATVTLDASGGASWTTSELAVGTNRIDVEYSGDGNFTGSLAGVNQEVTPAPVPPPPVVVPPSPPVAPPSPPVAPPSPPVAPPSPPVAPPSPPVMPPSPPVSPPTPPVVSTPTSLLTFFGQQVRMFDPVTGEAISSFTAFPGFVGKVVSARADLNGDGVADLAVGAGAGGGPHVRVFDGATGAELHSFFAFSQGFTGGVNLATGDVNGDGIIDLVVAAGPGGGPHVKVYDGRTFEVLSQFYAYDRGFTGGVNVTTGDLDGDGRAEIITGAGAGGGPHVKAFDGINLTEVLSYFAYDVGFTGGVSVAAGDLDGDGRAEIVTGAGTGGGPHVKAFDGRTLAVLHSFFAYDVAFTGGVSVAVRDVNRDGFAEIVTGAGAGGGPHVKAFGGRTLEVLQQFFATDATYTGGVSVG